MVACNMVMKLLPTASPFQSPTLILNYPGKHFPALEFAHFQRAWHMINDYVLNWNLASICNVWFGKEFCKHISAKIERKHNIECVFTKNYPLIKQSVALNQYCAVLWHPIWCIQKTNDNPFRLATLMEISCFPTVSWSF